MARGVNKVILLGNVGKDPELRYTQSGKAVANFSLATSEAFKQGDEWTEKTEWHNIVVWGRLAETCNEYLSKGKQVYIEGKIQTRKWEDRDGNTRYTTEINAREVQFLGTPGGGGGGVQRQSGGGAPPQSSSGSNDFPSGGGGGGYDDGFDPNDDVPF